MAVILMYNNNTNLMERYVRGENDPMPYSYGTTLLVKEFRGNSRSNLLWSTTNTMNSWNATRRSYGSPIDISACFKRPYEGGHSKQSQHYAGTAFDAANLTSSSERLRLYNTARSLGVWSYVEPISMTVRWVHMDKRYGTSACFTGGYPIVREKSVGVYVLILQDALTTLGFNTFGIDGYFGTNTINALKKFQFSNGLAADGICGCLSWSTLMNKVVGIGLTGTVVN